MSEAAIRAFSALGDVSNAARAIAAERDPHSLSIVFASTNYDLSALGAELGRLKVDRVLGAAAGRVIGATGFKPEGVAGVHLAPGRFAAMETLLDDVAAMALPELRGRVQALRRELDAIAGTRAHRFAVLLVDAEARCEERLAGVLGMELTGVPLIGGSAGDLYFNPLGHPPGSTRLLFQNQGRRGAAILCLIASESPVAAFCHNHYMPSSKKMVITEADPTRRLVREIDGRPALEVYAKACGFRKVPRESSEFSPFPLMIRIGGHYYARGMQRIYADGALEFACALEPGLVVALGRPGDMILSLEEMFAAMRQRIGSPALVIGVDCAARTALMQREGLSEGIEALLRRHQVVGFSSLGEQFNTVHANNSFTCLGIAS